ncbi:MAG: hypothetical protein LBF22_05435 [Deltaproteobacteria bacterium]|nr:hypothetical protein [Deltaproteobacteria bacterium]
MSFENSNQKFLKNPHLKGQDSADTGGYEGAAKDFCCIGLPCGVRGESQDLKFTGLRSSACDTMDRKPPLQAPGRQLVGVRYV